MKTEASSTPVADEAVANDNREPVISAVPPLDERLLASERTPEVREELVELARPIVRRYVRNVRNPRIARELEQACLVRIWKATDVAPADVPWVAQVLSHCKRAKQNFWTTDAGGKRKGAGQPEFTFFSARGKRGEDGETRTVGDAIAESEPDGEWLVGRDSKGNPQIDHEHTPEWQAKLDVHHLLARLSDEQRMVVQLVHLDGLSHAEAAVKMGVSKTQLGRLVAKAMDDLKRIATTQTNPGSKPHVVGNHT